MQFSPLRTAIIIIVSVLGILFTIPSFLPKDVLSAWPGFLPHQTVVLGLDLQGGSHLLLQVDKDSIVTARIKTLRRDVRTTLTNAGIGNLITAAPSSLSIELTDPTQKDAAAAELQKLQTTVTGSVGAQELAFSETADGKIVVALTPEGVTSRMAALVAQSMEVIRNRVDAIGTTEPTIQRQGEDRVLLQVPGYGDTERLIKLVSETARMTFHLVHTHDDRGAGRGPGYPIRLHHRAVQGWRLGTAERERRTGRRVTDQRLLGLRSAERSCRGELPVQHLGCHYFRPDHFGQCGQALRHRARWHCHHRAGHQPADHWRFGADLRQLYLAERR